MIFLADESVDYSIVKQLREAGYKVDYIAEINPAVTDKKVNGNSGSKAGYDSYLR